MAARSRRSACAPRSFRAPPQAALHDATKCAAPHLYSVLHATQGGAGRLCPLSRERFAQSFRYAGRADTIASPRRSQPLRQRKISVSRVTEIFFYHLERRTLEDVLPTLLLRSVDKGWRATVQASEERIEALDTWLWSFSEESFLPHGTTKDGQAEKQPIYLTAGADNPNGAQVRFLLDGAELIDAASYQRLVFIFDGRDAEAVQNA